jgi:hypothetical protein
MADPIAEIEVDLRRSVVTVKDAGDQRKRLKQAFERLTPDQAAALLKKILTWDGSRLPQDFRRPDRQTRLELLLMLVHRLGTQTASTLFVELQGEGKRAPDPKLARGLRIVFPDYAKAERDKFVAALKAGFKPSGIPSVLLEFRNNGKFSPDNRAEGLKFRDPEEPDDLGVLMRLGPSPVTGKNKMEIRGTVIGHRTDASYKFRRTIEQKSWYRAHSQWKLLAAPIPAGTNDDTHAADEDDSPENDHIYSTDEPGFTGPVTEPNLVGNLPLGDRNDATEAVFMINAIEVVDVRIAGAAWTPSAKLRWFSVTWLEKSGTTWRRKANLNKIGPGSIPDLDLATEPPQIF